MKYFVIGDVHGCVNELKLMINKLSINAEDTVIFLGDYIDRGKFSFEVIEYLLSLKYNCKFMMGNHEDMLINVLNNEYGSKKLWLYNGGMNTVKSYKDDISNIPQTHLDFLENLELCFETNNFFFVHAGINPNNKSVQTQEDMLWIRDVFIQNQIFDIGKVIVFGHTPFKEPVVQNNKVGIDTGLVFDEKLTCLELSYGEDTTKEDYIFHYVKKEK